MRNREMRWKTKLSFHMANIHFLSPLLSLIASSLFLLYTVTMQISKGPERLVSFTIGKIAYQLGETVSGTFDFSNSMVPCYQVFSKPILPPPPLSFSPCSSAASPALYSIILFNGERRFWYVWSQKRS